MIGMFTRNTEPHQKCSSSQPPVTGPRATARPVVADQMPMALARSVGSVNTLDRIARVAGNTSAAPMPIAARAAISPSAVPANAAQIDVAPKSRSPICMAPLRP